MREQKTKTIGDFTYTVMQHGALKGREVFLRLTKSLVPILDAIGKEDLAKAGGLLSSTELEFLCDTYAKLCNVTGGRYENKSPYVKDVFDDHFAGAYDEMLEWLFFCVDSDFGQLFKKAGINLQNLESLKKV